MGVPGYGRPAMALTAMSSPDLALAWSPAGLQDQEKIRFGQLPTAIITSWDGHVARQQGGFAEFPEGPRLLLFLAGGSASLQQVSRLWRVAAVQHC